MTTTPNPEAQSALASPKKFNAALIGYILLAVSLGLFCLVELTDAEYKDHLFDLFIVHYVMAGVYVVLLVVDGSYGMVRSWYKENLSNTVILLNLFLISAYALNRELPVFEDSVDWLCVVLLISSANLLGFRFFESLPRWVNILQYTLLGCSMVLYLYMTLFVSNYYIVGGIGIILFGIGAHIFVPLSLVVVSVVLIIYTRSRNISIIWIGAGAIIVISYAVIFISQWNTRVKAIEKMANQSVLYGTPELPVWVNVSQNMPNDWLSKCIIKSDLVYTVSSARFNDWMFMPTTRSWDEPRKHDPLVFIASLVAEPTLSKNDRIQILEATLDRHRAEERLWSGENLTTSYVVTDIDIWPDLRLAYTEKYLNIKNSVDKRAWNQTEEAIYTFQLPEGSVVTSLSLWIAGKEEKGILTSKQKATKAYTTIVGVEQRDPSVVHWQEGNTVTVRVFPCTPNEERKFKLGITSPLAIEGNTLIYKNIVFKGPSATTANETIRVRVPGYTGNLALPNDFKADKKGSYLAERPYDADFSLTLPAVEVRANNRFVFDGYEYALQAVQPAFGSLNTVEVYLDINQTWTNQELKEIEPLLTTAKVFVYQEGEFIPVTKENWSITADLQQRSFSLFPFHRLENPAGSLVITKGEILTPHLTDIKESLFAEGISKFFATGKKVYVYNLGTSVSTYISSLRELRAFNFAQGGAPQLISWLSEKRYPITAESDESVTLHDANLTITKNKIKEAATSNAPDHLARLFAYNDVMRRVGIDYFNNDYINDALVDEAATAYIVSPVSSLIVLETKEDYKRFGIEDKENSLHNASKDSSGAVPEPHEWALIILFALFVLYVSFRHKLKLAV